MYTPRRRIGWHMVIIDKDEQRSVYMVIAPAVMSQLLTTRADKVVTLC